MHFVKSRYIIKDDKLLSKVIINLATDYKGTVGVDFALKVTTVMLD
jgi:hypothetical protein